MKPSAENMIYTCSKCGLLSTVLSRQIYHVERCTNKRDLHKVDISSVSNIYENLKFNSSISTNDRQVNITPSIVEGNITHEILNELEYNTKSNHKHEKNKT